MHFLVGNFLSTLDDTYVLYLGEQEGLLQREERGLRLSLPQTLPGTQNKTNNEFANIPCGKKVNTILHYAVVKKLD